METAQIICSAWFFVEVCSIFLLMQKTNSLSADRTSSPGKNQFLSWTRVRVSSTHCSGPSTRRQFAGAQILRGSWIFLLEIVLSFKIISRSGAGFGSVRFWPSWIRIRILSSSSKKSKKTLISTDDFISVKNNVNVPSKSKKQKI